MGSVYSTVSVSVRDRRRSKRHRTVSTVHLCKVEPSVFFRNHYNETGHGDKTVLDHGEDDKTCSTVFVCECALVAAL